MVEQMDLFIASIENEKPSEKDLQQMFAKKDKQQRLTPRQWRLLDLIKNNSINEHRKTTQKEICDKLGEWGYKWKEKSGENHDHCSTIWNDIKDINLSYETDKLIISDNFEYWIGNEQETKEYIDSLWNELEGRLIRYWAFLKKVERNGQGQLIDRKGNPISENSKARDFIESYGKERISDY